MAIHPALMEAGAPYRFKPGQSGNPGGTRGAWTPADYLRFLQAGNYTVADLERISDDASEPPGKRGAAQLVLRMLTDKAADIAEKIEARRVFESINDRLEGRPTESHRVIDDTEPDPVKVVENLRQALVGT